MTDLYNTRHFENTLALEFSKSIETGRSLYLAVSDIDHFKKFNDTYGHKAGGRSFEGRSPGPESLLPRKPIRQL